MRVANRDLKNQISREEAITKRIESCPACHASRITFHSSLLPHRDSIVCRFGRLGREGRDYKHGVAHGFYFYEPSLHVYAVTEYWDPNDELSCHWADPDLGIPWPVQSAKVSQRDEESQSLQALLDQLEPSQRI